MGAILAKRKKQQLFAISRKVSNANQNSSNTDISLSLFLITVTGLSPGTVFYIKISMPKFQLVRSSCGK